MVLAHRKDLCLDAINDITRKANASAALRVIGTSCRYTKVNTVLTAFLTI
ncbi:hypothetical protein [Cupriavidus yeoncheonensis]|nr:hypothetical protein [Cupriavidus yeoncheonensis]